MKEFDGARVASVSVSKSLVFVSGHFYSTNHSNWKVLVFSSTTGEVMKMLKLEDYIVQEYYEEEDILVMKPSGYYKISLYHNMKHVIYSDDDISSDRLKEHHMTLPGYGHPLGTVKLLFPGKPRKNMDFYYFLRLSGKCLYVIQLDYKTHHILDEGKVVLNLDSSVLNMDAALKVDHFSRTVSFTIMENKGANVKTFPSVWIGTFILSAHGTSKGKLEESLPRSGQIKKLEYTYKKKKPRTYTLTSMLRSGKTFDVLQVFEGELY